MEDDSEWMFHPQQRPVSMPVDYDLDGTMNVQHVKPSSSRLYTRRQSKPRPMQTPTGPSMPINIPTNPSVIPGNNLPSAPASPPTPAPSPSPRRHAPDWSTAAVHEDLGICEDSDSDDVGSSSTLHFKNGSRGSMGLGYRHMRSLFADMDNEERKRMLAELLNMCDGKLLGFVAGFVGPRLKRDPFGVLPNELCLRVSGS